MTVLTHTVSGGALTVPEALMPFLHNHDGQAFQTVRPQGLTACAEITELALRGGAELGDGRVRATAQSDPDRAWVAEVSGALRESTPVKAWVRKRRGALDVQRDEAVRRGLLVPGRGRLAGLIPYPRHDVPEGLVEELADDLVGARDDPRAQAVARLVVRSRLHRRHDLPAATTRDLEALSEAAGDLPHPALDSIDVAIGITVLTAVTGE